MNKNIKLYPIYTMFSYDVLFYYAVYTIYFVTVKGLTVSDIALFSTFFSAACLIFQIPASSIVDKIGNKKSLIIGNILNIVWILIILLFNNFKLFLIGEVISGIGFALKNAATTTFLYSSLKKANRLNEYGRVEGKGSGAYFIIEAIACIISGYLYTISPYLPITFTAICFAVATIIALNFEEVTTPSEYASSREYFTSLKSSFSFIFHSPRLRALLLFSLVFYGVVTSSKLLTNAYFLEFNLSSEGFGYAFAIFAVLSAIGSRLERVIERKHKNNTLQFFSIFYIVLLTIAGILALFKFADSKIVYIGVICFGIQAFLKGAYRVVMKQYMTRYTTQKIRNTLMSFYYLVENIGNCVFSFITSIIIGTLSAHLSCIVMGIILFILIALVLVYMEKRVGLNPTTYTKKDRSDLI